MDSFRSQTYKQRLPSEREAPFLHALNNAAASLQRSSHSEEEVYRAFREQIRQLDLQGGIVAYHKLSHTFSFRILARPEHLQQIQPTLTEEKLIDFHFSENLVPIFQEVIASQAPVFSPQFTPNLTAIVPETEIEEFKTQLLASYPPNPAILAPIMVENEVEGILIMAGKTIDADAVPAVEAFTNHISVALENARLFAGLQQAESRFRALYDAALGGIVVAEPKTAKILSVNRRFIEILRYSETELVCKRVYDLVPEDYYHESRDHYLRLLAEGHAEFEQTLVRGDGSHILVKVSAALFHVNGETLVQGLVYDITESKRAEEELRRSEAKHRILLESIGLPVIALTPAMDILYCNQAYAALVDTPVVELTGKNLASLFPKFTHTSSFKGYQKALRTGKVQAIEGPMPNQRFLSAKIFPTEWGILVVGEDITERRQMEANLRESEERLLGLINTMPDIVCFKDGEGRWLVANDADRRLFQIEDVDYRGKKDSDLAEFSPFYRQAFLACETSDEQAWNAGRPYHTEEEIPTPSGAPIFLDLTKIPLFEPGGERKGLVVLGHDITERKITDNAMREMENILRRRAEELAALHEVTLKINAAQELPTLLKTIIEQAARLLNGAAGCFYLCNPDTQEVTCAVSYNTHGEDPYDQSGYGVGIVGKVAQSGKAFITSDYKSWAQENQQPVDSESAHAILSVPVIWQGEVTGVVHLRHYDETKDFTRAEMELLTLFANQAAIAIENTRLFEAERKARERAEAMREAARVIASSLSLRQVLQSVLDQLAKVLPYDSGNIMLLENDRALLKAGRGYDTFSSETPEMIWFDANQDQTIGYVLREKKPMMIANTLTHPAWKFLKLSNHIRSWLGVPLLARDQVIGLFSLDRVTLGGFDADEIALAQSFALHAAAAIENARLYEAEGQRAAELEALRRASLSLTASLDLPEVLDSILKSVMLLLPGCNNGHIFLFNVEGDNRLTFGAALWEDQSRREPFSPPRQEGLTYTVARSGEAIVIPDMSVHPLFLDKQPQWHGAIVGLPLKIGQRVVGVMNVSYLQPRQFLDSELRMLRSLGDQAAVAIENARLFDQAARERRHLSLLYAVNREIASSLNADEILDRAVSLTCQALGGILGAGFLYIPEENILSLRALFGISQEDRIGTNLPLRLEVGKGLAGWVYQYNQAAISGDVTQDPRWLMYPDLEEDVNSAIMAPIHAGDQSLGVMTVLHHQHEAFTSEHLDLLQAICQGLGLALSNASRYQQVGRRLNEITLIQSLAQTFNQRLELQTLMDEVVAQLAQRLGYKEIELFLIEGDRLVLKACHGPWPSKRAQSLEVGILGRVVRSGLPSFIPDVTHDPDYLCNNPETVAELAAPIFRRGAVVGVINVESNRPDQLNWQDYDLLKVLADQISVAVENAVLYEQVRRHAEDLEYTVAQRTNELTELYRLSQEIGYQLSYRDLLGLLLRYLCTAIRSDLAIGSVVTGGEPVLLVHTRFPLAPGLLAALPKRWQDTLKRHTDIPPALMNPPVEVVYASNFDPNAPPLQELHSFIHAPLMVNQKLSGLLIAASQPEATFSGEQLRLLNTFANQAASALQRLEAVLAAQQKHLESLVENLPVGTLLLDDDFRLLVANPLGRDLIYAINGNEPVGEKLARLGPYALPDIVKDLPEIPPVEITIAGPPRRIFVTQLHRVENPSSRLESASHQWVLTIFEVTFERENAERIQSQERLATVGQLAAGIAHDFNNIMAAILVYTDLMRGDANLPSASRDKLMVIQQQIQRAVSLIRQILDFSRRSVMEQSNLDLLPFIKELDKMLRRILPETIHVDLVYENGMYWVSADPTRLQQVFMNLALNARDAMPQGGILRFELSHFVLKPGETPPLPEIAPGKWVRIIVADNGIGITPEAARHLFEPFFTTKPVGQGTGLGLAQVYGIVKQHEGYIDVKSEPGEGTTFTIFLPALSLALPMEPRPETVTAVRGAGQTVLVVEDDKVTREALQALLETYNYLVLTARDGAEALERFHQFGGQIALVVSDIVMPQMGGIALYRQISARWPRVKMLLITGHPVESESQAVLQSGDVHWLQKPFSVQEFSQTISNLLSAPIRQD